MNIKKLWMKEIVLVIAAIVLVAWATSMAASAASFPNSPDNLSGGDTGSGGDIMYIPNSRPQNIGGGFCIQGYLTMEDGAIWLPMYQACETERR